MLVTVVLAFVVFGAVGYGVGIQTGPDRNTQTPGAYGWDGGFGTSWFNDPDRNLWLVEEVTTRLPGRV